MFEIKDRYDGKTIYTADCKTRAECVVGAGKSRADLPGANLYGANLSRANLYGANLPGANLSRADLYGADLSGANLSGANLSRANLYGADLPGAYLYGANLSGANLYGANLSGANLSRANLYGADLSGANLSGANLSRANLYGAKIDAIAIARTQIVPEEGAFVGWKKLGNAAIAQLVIPHDALRLNAYGSRKCRASKVFVHAIFGAESGYDKHTGKVLYKVGNEVVPDSFDDNKFIECSHGIHFFMRRAEAEAY
jgi:hypothetical protein